MELEEVVELVVGHLERRSSSETASPVRVAGGTDCCQDTQRQEEDGLEEEEEEEEETDGNTNSSFNPKYSVKLSESTNTMFPNYHSPDSIIVLQSTELKRTSSVRSHKTPKRHNNPDQTGPACDRIARHKALRDLLLGETVLTLSCKVLSLSTSSPQSWRSPSSP